MGSHNPLKLMIPGPVEVEQDVLDAMGSPVQPHYGPAWRDIYNETVETLKTIFGTRGSVFILIGSGSTGIDSCLGSLVATGGKIVVGANGFFGQRLVDVAEGYGLKVVPVTAEWGQPLRVEDFEETLKNHADASAVAVVHVETSTTIVNPIREIGRVARQHNIPFMVDAVSSLGGLPMRMDEWDIDLCASASQKCLGAPPGLSPVAVGPRGWEAIDRAPNKGHGWYLNLRIWREYSVKWGDWHPFPVTMATNNVLALKASLTSLLAEGMESRQERYRRLALRLRTGLRRIGMPPFTPDELLAPMLTAALVPEGVVSAQIVEYMSEVHQIKIAGGLGENLKDKIIRIGHMSPTLTEADIDRVIEALAAFTPDWKTRRTGSVATR